MSEEETAQRAVLLDLSRWVQTNGWWPARDDFRTRENHELLDEMARHHLVQVGHYFYTWTLSGLRLVKDDAFMAEELHRIGAVAEAMTKRLDAKKREAVTVHELAKELGWREPNEVRRAAYMLAISASGAINITQQVQGSNFIPEAISPNEGLWKLSKDLIMNGPPRRPTPPPPATRLLALSEPEAESGANEILFDPASRKVFVVHGHDEAAKEAVARLLEKLDLEAIVLHERPNKGRTIIEKFVDHAETAAFAVALLTPDDEGGVKPKGPKFRARRHNDRARQNVIFEAGYFIGRLGRQNVALLYKPGVELPSDVEGVIYIEMDAAGAWRLKLVAEIEAAGITVDANRLTSGDPRPARSSPTHQRARSKRRS